jgi:hypothetical protein
VAGKKPAQTVEADRLASVVLDADLLGVPRAARVNGVSEDTVRNYRKRILTRPEALEILRAKKTKLEERWVATRHQFLLRTVTKLQELCEKADKDQIREVAGAVKIVGDLHVVGGALNDGEQPEPDRPREEPEEAPQDASGGAEQAPLH